MLLLDSTSDIIRLVTGSAASVTVHVSWVDLTIATGAVTPGADDVPTITTATTTTLVPSPASGVARNIKAICITNNHATSATQVTVQHFDGTDSADLMGVSLLPGENLIMGETGCWVHHDINGAEYVANPQVSAPYGMSGTKAESVPRTLAGVAISGVTSGTMVMQAIWLPAGVTISNLMCMSGSTASASQTNRWMALYDQNRVLLRQSPDQTTNVFAGNSLYTAPITPYVTTYSGLYYIGIMTAATTVNSLIGVAAAGNAAIRGLTPALTGTSNTGLTTTAPATASAITPTVNSYWVAVS